MICNCSWTAEISQQWAKESAKLHPKLSVLGTEHITIEEPPADSSGGGQLTLT